MNRSRQHYRIHAQPAALAVRGSITSGVEVQNASNCNFFSESYPAYETRKSLSDEKVDRFSDRVKSNMNTEQPKSFDLAVIRRQEESVTSTVIATAAPTCPFSNDSPLGICKQSDHSFSSGRCDSIQNSFTMSTVSKPQSLETVNDDLSSPNPKVFRVNGGPEKSFSCRTNTDSPILPSQLNLINVNKKVTRKKKRSASWIQNVLNPSYKQKNDDFHKFFKLLPETERLLIDYPCALMKDILVQGRLYVSQNYVCFHSNILKWQTAVMMSFKDISTVTKEKTVKLFPNAIQFQMDNNRSKSTFTSFTHRDRTFRLISRLWQNTRLDKTRPIILNGDVDAMSSIHQQESLQDDILTSSVNQHLSSSEEDKSSSSSCLDEKSREEDVEKVTCQSSSENELNLYQHDNEPVESLITDLRKVCLVREFNFPAESMFQTLYGDDCSFWNDYMLSRNSFNINIGRWKEGSGENDGHKIRELNYHLTLTNPLGPNSSRVAEIQVWYTDATPGRYAVDCTAQTLGVPYADYFATIMRYCIRKLTGKTCELRISAELKFHKKPWGPVKSFIEKNCYSGIDENFNNLEKKLDAYVADAGCPFIRTNLPLPTKKAEDKLNISAENYSGISKSTSRKKVRKRDIIAGSSTPPFAIPFSEGPTNSSLNAKKHIGKLPVEKQLRYQMWFSRIVVILFSLLLFSNYSLYQRLHNLELLQSRISSNSLLFSTVNSNPVYNPPNLQGNSILEVLNKLEIRLRRLEDLVQSQLSMSDIIWKKTSSDLETLHNAMNDVLLISKTTEVKS